MDKLRGELTERDNLLIYYAGHGVLDVEADIGFWMSVDAEEGTQADWISIGTITGTVKVMSAKHVMIVSDSCYSGRLTRGLSVSVKTGAEREAELRRLAAEAFAHRARLGRSRAGERRWRWRPFGIHPRLPDGAPREHASAGRPATLHRRSPAGDRQRRSDPGVFRHPPRRPRRRRLPVRSGEPWRRGRGFIDGKRRGDQGKPRSRLLGVDPREPQCGGLRSVPIAIPQWDIRGVGAQSAGGSRGYRQRGARRPPSGRIRAGNAG